jgi:hypothetical protein
MKFVDLFFERFTLATLTYSWQFLTLAGPTETVTKPNSLEHIPTISVV